MMKSVMYIVTDDPEERCDLVSSVLAQAVTTLAYGYDCEIFLMDRGIKLAVKGHLDGLKSKAFDPLSVLLNSYREMKGKLYICDPSTSALGISQEDCIEVDGYVNASRLLESSGKAMAVFTY